MDAKVWQGFLVSNVIQVGGPSDPSQRLRMEWASSLDEHMTLRSISRKELVACLERVGCKVSVQAVGQWLRGETSPRPHHQAALAACLEVPVRRLFPIDAVSA